MTLPTNSRLLRIYLGESQSYHSKPLYEAIVLKARELGLAGATVLRGPLGFGRSSRLHTAKNLQLSEDLPVVVEIVESEDKLRLLLAAIDGMIAKKGILVTIERVEVLRHASKEP